MISKTNSIIAIVCCVVIMVVIVYSLCATNWYQTETYTDGLPNAACIYCLMMTGKDASRYQLAQFSIDNFSSQTYPVKKLIIVNHGNKRLTNIDTPPENVFEFMVDKTNKTLGDLRNIALQMVALNSLWTTWDDDDYRDPDYLSTLAQERTKQGVDVLCLTKRIDYNDNNGFSFVAHRLDGFVLFLAPQDSRTKYLSKDSMEDMQIISDYKQLGYTVGTIDNDPLMYVRLIHRTNTSLWVNPKKETIASNVNSIYQEYNVTDDQRTTVDNIMSTYYKRSK